MDVIDLKRKRQKVYNLKLEQRKFLPAFEEFFSKTLKNIRAEVRSLNKGKR